MQRVIGDRSSLDQEIGRSLQQYSGSILAPYSKEYTDVKRVIGSHGSLHQMSMLAELISVGRLPSVVINAPSRYSIYDGVILELCKRYDIPLVVVSLNATPLDVAPFSESYEEKRWKITTVNSLFRKHGRTLVITSESNARLLKQRPHTFWTPPEDAEREQERRSYIVIASELSEKIVSVSYDNLLVYGDVERWIVTADDIPQRMMTPRSIYEYSLYQQLAKNLYYENASIPTVVFPFEELVKERRLAKLILALYLSRSQLSRSLLSLLGVFADRSEEDLYAETERLGLTDRYDLPTQLGRRVAFYELDPYAGTFLAHWIDARHPVFPGIVIAAFLDQMMMFRPQRSSTNSLFDFLSYSHDLTKEVGSAVLLSSREDEKTISTWLRSSTEGSNVTNRNLYSIVEILSFCRIIKRLVRTIDVALFGLFHVDEAIRRARPIFSTIWGQNMAYLLEQNDELTIAIDLEGRRIGLPVNPTTVITARNDQHSEADTVDLPIIDLGK